MAKGTRSKDTGKTVIHRTVIKEVPASGGQQGQNWFSKNPLPAILLGLLVLVLLFVPLFPSTKTVQTTETVMVPTTTEMTVPGTTVKKTVKVYVGWLRTEDGWTQNFSAVDGIVEVRKSAAPGGSYTYTVVDSNGGEVIYRAVIASDLTKTGTTTIEESTGEGTKTGTQMVPQQVTKDKQVPTRVSLVQLMFGGN